MLQEDTGWNVQSRFGHVVTFITSLTHFQIFFNIFGSLCSDT